MRIAVIANGEWDAEWGKNELRQENFDLLIAVDGGGNNAIASGRLPDVLIGDLDSIDSDNLKACQLGETYIKKYPAEKNETDLELALEYAHKYLQAHGIPEDEIFLYAAMGKRLDHLLGNIALMLGYATKKRRIRMVSKNCQAWVITEGKEQLIGKKGQELSIIPLGAKARVSSKNLYYEMTDLVLLPSKARGISNIFLAQNAEIKVHEGTVLVVLLTES